VTLPRRKSASSVAGYPPSTPIGHAAAVTIGVLYSNLAVSIHGGSRCAAMTLASRSRSAVRALQLEITGTYEDQSECVDQVAPPRVLWTIGLVAPSCTHQQKQPEVHAGDRTVIIGCRPPRVNQLPVQTIPWSAILGQHDDIHILDRRISCSSPMSSFVAHCPAATSGPCGIHIWILMPPRTP
jgi:hypothetical protein